jgi:hypothetical protein
MLRSLLTIYPWDLIDEGVEVVLDRLHGEVGITGLSLWVAAPPITQLRVHDVEPRVFRTRGGLFFQPSDEHYSGTRCKPILSGWLKGRNPLAKAAEDCAERAIELRAIISASATGRIAQRHPEMACKNVYGAESHSSVCPANPDVQAYLCGLAADLSSSYSLAALTVADFRLAWQEAWEADLRMAASLGNVERLLLGTCFCESCHQKAAVAGVDVPSVGRSVKLVLERCLEGSAGPRQDLGALLADNEPLAAYFRWRTDELSTLLRRMKAACRCELLLARTLKAPEREQLEGFDLGIPDGVVTRLEAPNQIESVSTSGGRRSELWLPASFAVGPHVAELVGLLDQAVKLGFSAAEIDNYGVLPESALTPVKQTIRFARRSADD